MSRSWALALDVIPTGGFTLKDTAARPAPPTMRLGYVGDDRFVVRDGVMKGRRGECLRDRQGKITWLRPSRVFRRKA